MAKDALFHRDDGTRNVPGEDSAWDQWVSATRTRNFIEGDTILDWLDTYGEEKGFQRDDQLATFDERTDFGQFVIQKGLQFEQVVVDHLTSTRQVERIATGGADARSRDAVMRTWDAMTAGTEIITQAPIWNAENQTYGVIDLLVRSDVLAELFPDHAAGDPNEPAPDIPGAAWHYRVIDIKYSTLQLLANGHVGSKQMDYAAQVWVYNQAVGRLQGLTPASAYLLGRGWKNSNDRGSSATEALGRVDHDYAKRDGTTLESLAMDGCDWIRRVRSEGAGWDVLPEPSVPELRPNMRNVQDAPWHAKKRRIGAELEDLTILPRVNPAKRDAAMADGLMRWTDPDCTAARLGITGNVNPGVVDAVIAANQSPADRPIVFPATITAPSALKHPFHRLPADFELAAPEAVWDLSRQAAGIYVDFETVSDLDDDFSAFPEKGGQPMIFMVGCGYTEPDGTWTLNVHTADRVVPEDEAAILNAWLAEMQARCAKSDCELADARIYHWSPAETVTIETAYNSAAARHGATTWGNLPWVDLLKHVIRAEPVTVRGAFGSGLKAITKSMHAAGLIDTAWPDGVADGLGAMVGAWWCDSEAERTGVSMTTLDMPRASPNKLSWAFWKGARKEGSPDAEKNGPGM